MTRSYHHQLHSRDTLLVGVPDQPFWDLRPVEHSRPSDNFLFYYSWAFILNTWPMLTHEPTASGMGQGTVASSSGRSTNRPTHTTSAPFLRYAQVDYVHALLSCHTYAACTPSHRLKAHHPLPAIQADLLLCSTPRYNTTLITSNISENSKHSLSKASIYRLYHAFNLWALEILKGTHEVAPQVGKTSH